MKAFRQDRRNRRATSNVFEPLELRALFSGGPIGDEFMVNTYTPGYQVNAAVATDADGDSVVVWETETGTFDGYDIHGQRYDALGEPVGEEFLVSTLQTHFQYDPDVAMDAAGNFVVTWGTYYPEHQGIQIGARLFNADGTPRGDEFMVNTDPTGQAYFGAPDVVMNDSGAFVITYEQRGRIDDPTDTGILERRFNADGTPIGNDFFVNTYDAGVPLAPAIAMDNAGNSVVVWHNAQPGGQNRDVYMQRYDVSGAPVGGETRVNTILPEWQVNPDVAMDSDGDFVVTWDGGDNWGVEDVFARQFSAAGEAQGEEFRVNAAQPWRQHDPVVSMAGDGSFVVAWNSWDEEESVGQGVFAQRFDPAGARLGEEFRLNANVEGPQMNPAVATDEQGDVIAVFSDPIINGPSTADYDYNIIGRLFNVSDVAPLTVMATTPTLNDTHSVTIQFDDDVYTTFGANDIELIGLQGTASVPASAIRATYDADARTATLTFPGLTNGRLPDGRYRARVISAGLTDVIGNRMTADHTKDFRVITGDADGNGVINFDDYARIDNGFNNRLIGYSNGDFNRDGAINFDDYALIDLAFNTQ